MIQMPQDLGLKCLIFVQLQYLAVSDVFDLITPKTVPNNVKLYRRGVDKSNNIVFNKSRIENTWTRYIDANLKHAIKSCLFTRKKGNFLLEMRKCLMNCSPSCQVMKRYFRHKCVDLKVGRTDALYIFHLMKHSRKNSDNFQRHLLNSDFCPIAYPNNALLMYQKLLALSVFTFLTDVNLRINVTFLHFDVLQKNGCLRYCADGRIEGLAYVHFVNSRTKHFRPPFRGGISFEVSTFTRGGSYVHCSTVVQRECMTCILIQGTCLYEVASCLR